MFEFELLAWNRQGLEFEILPFAYVAFLEGFHLGCFFLESQPSGEIVRDVENYWLVSKKILEIGSAWEVRPSLIIYENFRKFYIG